MRLAFAIVSMFPWGGLQRDCVRLALKARDLGHAVTIFTSRTRGNIPDDIGVEMLPIRAITNHGRNREFGKALAQATLGRFDRVIGFDKIEGLDILYCGDLSFADRMSGNWTRLNPRVRAMIELEGACFSAGSRTRILALAQPQIEGYRRAWGTPVGRIRLLPPPIDSGRRQPEYRADGTRERMRRQLGLAPEDLVALCVGSPTPNKGFDRAIAALADAPRWKLVICGVARASREGARFLAQARRHGVADRVHLLAPREDMPRVMAAADLLVHPAFAETTGNVILEAVINGLPVIATENCGFAPHVKRANAGIVIPEPFQQSALNEALKAAMDASSRARWSASAAAYGADPTLYSGIDSAVRAIVGPIRSEASRETGRTRLAFGIVSLFRWGGLQRNCLRLAREAMDAGHEVTIFTSRIQGDIPDDIHVRLLPLRSFTNHGRNREFGEALKQATAGRFDRVVGFDKHEGLDIHYSGDLCFADRKFGFWSRLNPRIRGMIELEGACFSVDSATHILGLAESQIDAYRRVWRTPEQRIKILPPPIESDRRHPEYRMDGTRERMRRELGLAPDDLAILCVGAWAHRKGFDRAVDALAEDPRWKLLICGIGPASREGAMLLSLARRLDVANRIHLLGPREDVIQVMAATDLFVHVARAETAGYVILEAIVNGLPAIVSKTCGFAPHVTKADAGIVLGEPFRHADLTDALAIAADPARRARWSANAAAYGADPVLYSGIDHALKAILANA